MHVTHELAGPLLGRDSEIALITSLLDGIESGGRALVLRGEPGIGKSSLLLKSIALAEARGITTLSITGAQPETELAYAGLERLLRPIRGASLPSPLAAALEVDLVSGEPVAAERFGVANAVLDLLTELATKTPLLVTVDDAHWLDRASSDVLAFVARRLEFDPIVLIATTTDGSRPGLTDASLPELRLSRLDRATAARLLEARSPDLGEVERDRVLREAVGNPLALIELPKAGPSLDSSTPLPGVLPLTARLERSFAARTADLPSDTRLLLLVISLLDGDDVNEVIRAASNAAGRVVELEALEPGVAAGILDLDVRTVRFRHPLMRSAVGQSASIAQQRRVHEVLAEMLANQPDRRVWHQAALITGEHETVATELEKAARRARRRGATGEAFSAMRRSADLSEPSRRTQRLLVAAELGYELGQLESVAPLLREARQLEPGPAQRARVTWIEELIRARPIDTAQRASALIQAAKDAAMAGDRELHLELLTLVTLRSWWAGPSPAVGDLLREPSARMFDTDARDPRALAAYAYVDPVGRSPAVLARLTAARQDGHDTDAFRYLSESALVIGAFDFAVHFLPLAVEGLRKEGRLGPLPRVLALYGLVAARLADWDTAIPAAEESSRLAAEFREPLGAARADSVLATIAGMRGDAETMERAATSAERLGAAVGSHATVAFAQVGRVIQALGTGQHADAYRTARRLFDPSDPAYHPSVGTWMLGEFAEAAVRVDAAEDARGRVAQVEAAAGQNPPVALALGLAHARAVLAKATPEADTRFVEALGADLSQWPFQRARLLLAYGQWLRRQRRITESRDPLRTARDTFDTLGCAAWSETARHELRASGESSRRGDPAARDLLTPQELQISTLAAEGLSNGEIAQRLYLSPRTVSTHLYRAFPKLGISGRAELSDALSPKNPGA